MADSESMIISPSQSLFQVYYLSAIEVDRRCSTGVLPWFIEELKLKLETAHDMKLIWITLGPESISYVADSGLDIQHHPYSDIIRCTTGQDNVSFAYIIHSEKDSRSYCHVFQSLIPDEATTISTLLQYHGVSMNGKNEPRTILGNKLISLIRQSKKINRFTAGRSLSSRRNSIDPSNNTLFPITYCGTMPYKANQVADDTVDKFVRCLQTQNRPTSAERYKKWTRRKRSSTFAAASKTNGIFRLTSSGSDETDFPRPSGTEGNRGSENDEDDDLAMMAATKSLSDLDSIETSINPIPSPANSPNMLHPSPELGVVNGGGRTRSDSKQSESGSKHKPWSFHIKKKKSFGSKENSMSTSSLKGDDSPQNLLRYETSSLGGSIGSLRETGSDAEIKCTPPPQRAETVPSVMTTPKPAIRVTDNFDSSEEIEDDADEKENSEQTFDMVPELDEMSLDPEFSTLGTDGFVKQIRQYMSSPTSATLTISGTKIAISAMKPSTPECDHDNEESVEYKNVCVLEASVIQVICCSQGRNTPEYVAFVTHQQKGVKTYQLHLVRAVGDRAASDIVKAFKYAFEYSLVQQIPTYLCHTCPIRQLNSICKELNKQSASESLLHLKSIMLSVLSDADYSMIAKDYKKQPFENDHNQVVRWLSLTRLFLHRHQLSHVHHDIEKEKASKSKLPIFHSKKKNKSTSQNAGSQEVNKDEKSDLKTTDSTGSLQTDSVSERVGSPLAMASTAILESQFSGDINQDKSVESYSHNLSMFKNTFPNSASFPPPTMKIKSPPVDLALENSLSPISSGSSNVESGSITKGHKRSMSWRQQIFESVTPSKGDEVMKRRASITQIVMETPNQLIQLHLTDSISEEEHTPSAIARRRWKWVIEQQLLLLRMEKLNQSVINAEQRNLKLNYEDSTINNIVIGKVWSDLIEQKSHSHDDLFAAVKMGVPPKMREKVWKLLVSYYHSLHPGEVPMGNYPSSLEMVEYERYKGLTTEYESVIVADIDRTFPTHPYFISSEGQEALYRVLHAYAVSDRDCGYCQGLSFVAGIVLIHSPNEIEAFVLLNHLMFLYGFREIYSQNMFVLQTKLYQFSRLLHDQHPELYAHLDDHDVSPFLYAAPWFLTIFSSQFPIPFVARVYDFVFFEGVEAIFKVSLSLLQHYQYDLLQLDNMETITEFLKTSIPYRVSNDSSEILHSSMQLGDLSSKLKTFETEYIVMHDLMSAFHLEKKVAISDTESMNELLRKQNKDLIEQVVLCRGAIMRLEEKVDVLQKAYNSQQLQLNEQERKLKRLENNVRPAAVSDDSIPVVTSITTSSSTQTEYDDCIPSDATLMVAASSGSDSDTIDNKGPIPVPDWNGDSGVAVDSKKDDVI